MGIERTSESFIPSQKNEGGKYLTTDGNNAFWDTVSSGISGNYVASISGTTNEIEVSGSGSSSASVILSLPSTINANTTGNAATATKLQTARSIALSGDVSGSANFDGSAGISITATVADDSHNHIISNIDGLQTALDGKQTLDADLTAIAALSGTSGFLKKTAADTWSLDTNTYLTGNQTITLTGDATGSGTTSIVVTVADDSHNHIISNVDGLQTALDAKLDSTSYTASDVLTKIKTVDGSTSGLDSDLLDGQEGSYYLDWTNTTNKPDPTITLGGDASGSLTLTDLAGGTLTVTIADDSHNHIISNVDGLQTALDAKAPLESPALSGIPTAPTASASANSTQIATTAFVQTAVSNLINGAPGALDTLDELAAALGDDANFATTITNSLAGKQPLDADLTAIAALAGTSGFLKKTAADTWSLDTNTYLTGNQSISISGDATGSGTTSISLTLANSGVTANSYGSSSSVPTFTVDAKGRLTAASNTAIEIAQSAVTNLTTDLSAKAPLASPTFTGTVTVPTLSLTTTDTATTATHYMVETATDGIVRPKTLANVRTEIVTNDAVNAAAATTVGTITSGTWAATDIGLAHGGTNASLTAANGAVVYSTSSALALTSVGTTGQVLTSNGAGAPTWQEPSGGGEFSAFLLAGM